MRRARVPQLRRASLFRQLLADQPVLFRVPPLGDPANPTRWPTRSRQRLGASQARDLVRIPPIVISPSTPS